MKLIKATDGIHKYVAVFNDKRVPFGAKGYTDFTQHGDLKRKESYLARHQHEDWNNPKTAGALSRWLLWNRRTLKESLADYTKRFPSV